MISPKNIAIKPVATVKAPLPLVSTLPNVEKLSKKMLPPQLCDYIFDVAERTQCPPEYVAVSSIVALSAVVGNKYAIMPKQHDNWEVCVNQWGAVIGPPSAMKSPALKDAIRPIIELEKENAEIQQIGIEEHMHLTELTKANMAGSKKEAAALLQDGRKDEALAMMKESQFDQEPPSLQRYIVNDASVEKLGELLNENPNGMLLNRDELSGFFAKLSQEDSQMDRAFYLECFDGNGRFTYDRIGRGTIIIENCMLSVLGGIQPSKIAKLIRLAISGQADDGLVQRLQLAVWPDPVGNWQWKDQAPNQEAYAAYRDTARAFHNLKSNDADGGSKLLRFTPDAQALFAGWMTNLQADIRNSDYHPVIQSHFAKSPKAIAGLALLFELIEGGRTEVGTAATAKALKWAAFLKSHALRLYSISTSSAMDSAKLILSRRSKLKPAFTAREIRRKGWAGLTEPADVVDAVDTLIDHNYLIELKPPPGPSGGRPTTQYRWSPAIEQKV